MFLVRAGAPPRGPHVQPGGGAGGSFSRPAIAGGGTRATGGSQEQCEAPPPYSLPSPCRSPGVRSGLGGFHEPPSDSLTLGRNVLPKRPHHNRSLDVKLDSCTLGMRAALATLEPSYHEFDHPPAGSYRARPGL